MNSNAGYASASGSPKAKRCWRLTKFFRGDFRLKIPFATIQSAEVLNGHLHLDTVEGVAIFDLGGGKVVRRRFFIRKSRIEKLGIKTGAKVALIGFGKLHEDFFGEIAERTKFVTKSDVQQNGMDFFEGGDAEGACAAFQDFQGHARCGCAVDCLSKRTAYDHRKRRSIGGTKSRTKRPKGCWIFRDAHRVEICHSNFATLIHFGRPRLEISPTFLFRDLKFVSIMCAWA